MLKKLQILTFLLIIATICFLTRTSIKQNSLNTIDFLIDKSLIFNSLNEENIDSQYKDFPITDDYNHTENKILSAVMQQGNGILFVETTDRMDEPSLVLCSIESAARVYPDRPVVFFMKALGNIVTDDDEKKARKHYPTLSIYKNIYFLPLRLEKLFANTPLLPWYKKVNPHREVYWTHVKSDACRFALMWKYGGIYMDTDVISIRPIPEDNFLAAETFSTTSSSVFGLSSYHTLTWEFMENFVQNYRGSKWGHQGPGVFTRVVKKHCGVPKFIYIDHTKCANVSYFHPERFYPILYPSWKRYFEVWSKLPTFKNSFALHLWNYMNDEKETMVPRTNTLVERLYQQYCPSTYDAILNSKATYL
ncbi:alpha-1,4-N-acetylglucosaminyltransferase-like [Ranitomeya variabilis]|uniref:alpha-1,4-N-acetylglucosaminyltransferase-like n=1 Tax=Ranitomeya variabilis TaxID=490064 RepID=UPI004055F00B